MSAAAAAALPGVYQRHDWAAEKRAALDAWAAHVVSVVKGRIGGDKVVTLARTARVSSTDFGPASAA